MYFRGKNGDKANGASQYDLYLFQRYRNDGPLYDGLTTPEGYTTHVDSNRYRNHKEYYQWGFNLSYHKKIGKHTVNGVYGIEKSNQDGEYDYFRFRSEGEYRSKEEYGGTDVSLAGGRGSGKEGVMSHLLQLNYGYADKYFIDLSARIESLTGDDEWRCDYRKFYPALSVAWVMSNENFFKDQTEWLNLLKVRGSIRWLGKDNIQDFF